MNLINQYWIELLAIVGIIVALLFPNDQSNVLKLSTNLFILSFLIIIGVTFFLSSINPLKYTAIPLFFGGYGTLILSSLRKITKDKVMFVLIPSAFCVLHILWQILNINHLKIADYLMILPVGLFSIQLIKTRELARIIILAMLYPIIQLLYLL